MEPMSTQHEVKQLKSDLQEQMRRCPSSVRDGSHNYVIEFKRAWTAAHRVLHGERSTRQAVLDALRVLKGFGE